MILETLQLLLQLIKKHECVHTKIVLSVLSQLHCKEPPSLDFAIWWTKWKKKRIHVTPIRQHEDMCIFIIILEPYIISIWRKKCTYSNTTHSVNCQYEGFIQFRWNIVSRPETELKTKDCSRLSHRVVMKSLARHWAGLFVELAANCAVQSAFLTHRCTFQGRHWHNGT